MATRLISESEKYFITPQAMEFVQLAIKFPNESYKSFVLDRFLKAIVGLHTKVEGDRFIAHDDFVPVQEIPKNIRNPYDVCEWMRLNKTPQITKSLGVIAASKDMVAINISHVVADGGYLTTLLENCTNPYFSTARPQLSSSPLDMFRDEFNKIKNPADLITPSSELTKIKYTRNTPYDQCEFRYSDFSHTFDQLKCYDKTSQKLSGLTDALWVAIGLSVNAFNHDLGKYGASTCVNLRQFLKPGQENLGCCNLFTTVSISVPGVTEDMSLGELALRFRTDYQTKTSDGTVFAKIGKAVDDSYPGHGVMCLSNVGRPQVPAHVTNFYMQQSMCGAGTPPYPCVLAFRNKPDSILVKLRHATPILTPLEAQKIAQGMSFSLTQLQPNMTVREALYEMERFQNKIK